MTSHLQSEPKTIEDYKDIVKILKLKIIKQNKKIQELQLKNKSYEDQLNGVTIGGGEDWPQPDESKKRKEDNLKGKVQVMTAFGDGVKKVGITPQAVFRIADSGYKGFVQSDLFRDIIAKMKLGLTPKEISSLVFIFDEHCTGFISREQYYSSLHAYKITAEEQPHHYLQQCLMKLSALLYRDKINPSKFYQEMEARARQKSPTISSPRIDLNIFQEQIKKLYSGKVQQRQIVGCFNSIDLQSQGYIQKNNLIYCITSYINKLLAGDDLSKKQGKQWNTTNGKSQITQPDKERSPNKKSIQNRQDSNSKIYPPSKITPDYGPLAKLQSQYSLKLPTIYSELLHLSFTHRITLSLFIRSVLKIAPKVPHDLICALFRQIDADHKGSLYFNELISYFISNGHDTDIIFKLMGKYFHANDLDAEKFWYMFGLSVDSQISKGKFIQIMIKNFGGKAQKGWDYIWSHFDKGRGAVNVGTIVKTLQKYELQ